MNKVFEKFRKNNAYKDSGIGWYLRSYTDTLQRKVDELDGAEGVSQRAAAVAYKRGL